MKLVLAFSLIGSVALLSQQVPPAKKTVTDVGKWQSVTTSAGDTLRTGWRFDSFSRVCGEAVPSQTTILATGPIPALALEVSVYKERVYLGSYYGNYKFVISSGFKDDPGLNEAVAGYWGQYAEVFSWWNQGDDWLIPWGGGLAGVVGYWYDTNPKVVSDEYTLIVHHNGGIFTIDSALRSDNYPQSFTYGSQGSALDAGSVIQAAAFSQTTDAKALDVFNPSLKREEGVQPEGGCFTYGKITTVLWLH